jgi:hypothetical protein
LIGKQPRRGCASMPGLAWPGMFFFHHLLFRQ